MPHREHSGAAPALVGVVLDRSGGRSAGRTRPGERNDLSQRGVVVGFDGSTGAGRATRWAAIEAAVRHCPLHVVRVVASTTDSGSATILAEENRRLWRECVAELRGDVAVCGSLDDGLDVRTAAVPGGAVGGRLAEYARNVEAGMVVVSGEPSGGSHPVFGSVGAELVAATAVPVVVVRSSAQNSTSAPRSPGVMAVCDDGATSARVLRAAFGIAGRWGAKLTIVHVERRASGLVRGVAAHVFRRQLHGCAALYPDVSARVSAVGECPAQAVLAVSQDAGLLVLGDRGRSLGQGVVTGSVSYTALHHARSSVALV